MRRLDLMILTMALFASTPLSVLAEEVTQSNTKNQSDLGSAAKAMKPSKDATVTDSPADKAYQEKMLQLSNAISQKIAEVQAKQKELDEEIYPASKPPLQLELDNLNKELDALRMQKEQLDAQKTATEMEKKLKDPAGSSAK